MEHEKFRIVDGKITDMSKIGNEPTSSVTTTHKEPIKVVGYVKGCHHYRQPVAIGKYQFYVTAYREMREVMHLGKDEGILVPDYGLYFANEWLNLMGDIWSNKLSIPTDGTVKYPCTVVNWKDFGTVKKEVVDKLIQIVCTRAGMGQKVDIGCFGSHGRTGTFLSCLLGRVEHLDGVLAIRELRKRYCNWAVESQEQINFILLYLARYEQERIKEVPLDTDTQVKMVIPNAR